MAERRCIVPRSCVPGLLSSLRGLMSGAITVTFHGVRGSTPCDEPHSAGIGGNTSCVVIEAEDQTPIILDLGTGLRRYGMSLLKSGNASDFRGSVLLSHLHWDHVQGLPFFEPLHDSTSMLDIYGPEQPEGSLCEVFAGFMRPPFFPIRPEGLAGTVAFHDVGNGEFQVGRARVRSRWVRHIGPTLGFRIEIDGVAVAYVPDHGQGCVEGTPDDHVPNDVVELCRDVDLLIHDAQHTANEFEAKWHWGHCTPEYAVNVASKSSVRRLALFHHDPCHDDVAVATIEREARDLAATTGLSEVFAACEGMVVTIGRPAATGGR